MANKSPRGLSYPVVSACDLPAVIDIAGLSVIFAQRRESAVAELPKKRATGKVCAEAANVFAVRVRSRRFGVTHASGTPKTRHRLAAETPSTLMSPKAASQAT